MYIPAIPIADDPFIQAVSRIAEQLLNGLTKRRLLIAHSGGPDSTALLAVFAALRQQHGLSMHVLHVNHGLRAAESDEDEEFCRWLCAAWTVDFLVHKLHGEVHDEATLRHQRYAALATRAEELSVDAIFTGHTLDDQAETLLFRLFRGTSPAGMIGIPAKRIIRGSSPVVVMRPLLAVTRLDAMDFLSRTQIPFRIDSSNAEQHYTRNFIRHALLPQIEQRFPATVDKLESFRALLTEDQLLLDELARAAHETVMLGGANPGDSFDVMSAQTATDIAMRSMPDEQWCREAFLRQPISLQRRIITNSLRNRDADVSFPVVDRILQLCRYGHGELCVSREHRVVCTTDRIKWRCRPSRGQGAAAGTFEKPVLLPGLTDAAELRATINVCEFSADVTDPADLQFPPAQSFQALVDLSSIDAPLVLRHRRAGDRIQPFGMNQLVRLKKYLHSHKSSALVSAREITVLADQHEVLWVPGIGLSEKLRSRGMPTHRLEFIRWKPS